MLDHSAATPNCLPVEQVPSKIAIDRHGDCRQKQWEKRETMDSLVSKYTPGSSRDTMDRWVDWQRDAELEIEKSKNTWTDTDKSRAAIDSGFASGRSRSRQYFG